MARRWDAGAGHGGLAFAPGGEVLASGGGSCVRLWDPATGKEVAPATGHTAPVRELRFAPDGKTLFSCGADKKVLAWDLTTGRERILGAQSVSYVADFSPDGKVLAQTVYDDPHIRLRDAASGKELLALKVNQKVDWRLRFSPDGKVLASSDEDSIRLWDVASGKTLHSLEEHRLTASPLAFSPDGKVLAFVGSDKKIGLWEVATGKELRRWPCFEEWVRWLAFSPDGTTVISQGDSDPTIRVWDIATGKQLAHFGGLERHPHLALSPNGRTLAVAELVDHFSGGDEKAACTVYLWDTFSGQMIRKIPMPQGSVGSLAFAPDGRTLATGGGDSTILLWDLTARAKDGKSQPSSLTAADLDQLWTDLAGDAPKADGALWALARAPKQSLHFLRQRLRPVAISADHAKLVADLDSKQFAVRDKAFRTLDELGGAAEAVLHKTLREKPSLEVQRRLEQLLEKRRKDAIRPLRALEALEQIGTAEARQVLEVLAKGAANPRVGAAGAALPALDASRRQ